MSIILFFLFFSLAYSQQKTIGLTKYKSGQFDNGYILFAPLECKTTFLIDRCGRKVHSWKSKYNPGLSAYLLLDGNLLRTGVSNDTFFRKGSNGGIIEKIDWDGNVIWSYVLSNDSLGQHHDIFPMDNGNILVIAKHIISREKALDKGRKPGTIGGKRMYSERIIELKPKGTNDAQVVWQWSLWDHIIQDESKTKPNYGDILKHPELMNINFAPMQSADWIHFNSIDYNKELDQILLSCKSLNEIWIIDHSTTTKQASSHTGGKSGKGGDLLYRWGNPIAYNGGTVSDQKFYHQHNAHWIPKGFKDAGDIMVFNNGLGRIPTYSSVEILALPVTSTGSYSISLPFGPVEQKWIYSDSIPENFFSGFKSGASRLANGNTLICAGLSGRFFEIDSNNSIVWEYINPVAQGDNVLTDGETGGAVVFKCIYYSETYSGFKNKILLASEPIEKKPHNYLCVSQMPDTISPIVLNFFPRNEAKKISVHSPISIEFNENIYKGTLGNIQIFENNLLKETISISDDKIKIEGNSFTITTSDKFSSRSKISVSIDQGTFTDFSGNKISIINARNWNFKTDR